MRRGSSAALSAATIDISASLTHEREGRRGMRQLRLAASGAVLTLTCLGSGGVAEARAKHPAPHTHSQKYPAAAHRRPAARGNPAPHIQRGIASVYAEKFRGRRMADGTRFDPVSNAAASKNLPLGTTAHVTNLKTGRTAMVEIRDRGPHRAGRIIDVSPGSAGALGIDRHGTAPVAVAPTRRSRD